METIKQIVENVAHDGNAVAALEEVRTIICNIAAKIHKKRTYRSKEVFTILTRAHHELGYMLNEIMQGEPTEWDR